MAMTKLSDEILLETIKNFYLYGSFGAASSITNLPRTTFQHRYSEAKRRYPNINSLEEVEKFLSTHTIKSSPTKITNYSYPPAFAPKFEIKSMLIGGDSHFWPGNPSVMWKAFTKLAHDLQPDCIILNGDVLDGASISKHGKTMRSSAPKITQEIEAAQERLSELPKCSTKIWTLGNHDVRIDNYIANMNSEIEEYVGSFVDRFPDWEFAHSAFINNVEIRHRFRGGIHAAWNNALHSGVNIITSHTHQLNIIPVRNRNGTHYGIECGMLADPLHPCFEYTEFSPSRVCSGFVYITFDDEKNIMPPMSCEMIRGRPAYQGKYVF